MHQPLAATVDLMDRIARMMPGRSASACVSLTLPGQRIRGLPTGLSGACYWERAESGHRLLSIGRAWQADASGPGRLDRLRMSLQAFSTRLKVLDPDGTGSEPRFLMMASFSDEATDALPQTPSASLWLPQVLLEEIDNRCRLCVSLSGDWETALDQLMPALDGHQRPVAKTQRLERVSEMPSADRWLDEASLALTEIRCGRMAKVVLARRVEVRGRYPFDPVRLVRLLSARHPKTTVFALDTGQGCLVAATPERLLSARSGHVQSDALAGTAPRGLTADEDRQISEWLLRDNKNRQEHGLVVDAVRQAMAAHCVEALAPTEPSLYRTGGLQHLHTPIAGRLR